MNSMFVAVLLFAICGAVGFGCLYGVGYAFGVQYTAARLMTILLSGAGIGGLLAMIGAVVNDAVSRSDTTKVIVAFALLVAMLVTVAVVWMPR